MTSDVPPRIPDARDASAGGERAAQTGDVAPGMAPARSAVQETRKVLVVGGSTYAVSLPKGWVDQVGLRPGASVELRLRADGSILVVPPAGRARPHLTCRLTLDASDDDEIVRTIIGAYLGGYETVHLRTRRRPVASLEEPVRRALDRVRGLVVVEQGVDTLVLQDLLDPREFNARKALHRMHVQAHAMLTDAVDLVTGRVTGTSPEGLEHRDDELDRILLILVKQHHLLMRDLTFTDRIGIPPEESLNHLLVAHYLERIGDYALRIARTGRLPAAAAGGSPGRHLRGMAELALRALDGAVAAFRRRDAHQAHETIRLSQRLGQLAQRIPSDIVEGPTRAQTLHTWDDCLGFLRVFESLERVGLYAKSLAEVAINHALGGPAPGPAGGPGRPRP